jgi:uncharacterized protein (DUF58 family)
VGQGWLLLASATLILAVILRQGGLLLVAVLLLMLYGVSQIWARYALRRVEYTRRLSTNRAFCGEEITFETSLANRKVLPLPWVQIDEEMDEQLVLPAAVVTAPSHRPGRVVLRNIMPVGWYHRVKRVYTIRCTKRGYFSFGPTRIQSGDYFRFRVREMDVGGPTNLIVYPRMVPLSQLGIPSRDPFGDIRVRRHLFQDPVRVASIREYAPGDPLKRIHWKATARIGRLQTKIFEHTTSTDLAIFFDVRTVKHPFWGEFVQLLETGAIAAASIANHAIDKGYRVGLYVNHPYPDSASLIRIKPSSHPEQLQHILEALAMVAPTESVAIDRLVRQEGGTLPWVSTLVAVTAVPTPGLVSALETFARAGRPVALIMVGDPKPDFSTGALTVYHVPAEVAWDKVDAVAVNPTP